MQAFVPPSNWLPPKTVPMDVEWKNLRSEHDAQILNNIAKQDQPKYIELRRRLLLLGGEGTCISHDPDIDNILNNAVACKGYKTMRVKGTPCRCHQNVGYIADKNQTLQIATGYALSKDGVWRCHSWLINTTKPFSMSGRHLIETTVGRVAYYGFPLSKKQQDKWFYDNCL